MVAKRQLRRRRDGRTTIVLLAVLLVLLTGILYLLQRSQGLDSTLLTNKVLLFVLWYVDVVLILAIVFVLLRNVFKLLVERRYKILGSQFKTKLMLTYVGLSLIPVLLLFVIATELLENSIERWFSPERQESFEQGREVAYALRERVEAENAASAQRALEAIAGYDLEDPAERPALAGRLQALSGELGVDYLALYQGTDFIHAVVDPRADFTDLPEPGRTFLAEAASEGEASERLGVRLFLTARAAPPPAAEAAPPEDPPAEAETPAAEALAATPVVVAGQRLPASLAEAHDRLIQNDQSFRQLAVQREELTASHLLFFLMVTLLILLASSWVGLYLARRITVPIQALAAATRHLRRGELSHRVEVPADDELGALVDSFNRMSDELERSNRELVETNRDLAEERALLAAVLGSVAAAVVATDPSGRIVAANRVACGILRQREEELLGRPVEEVWSDPERAKLAALLGERAEEGEEEVVLALGERRRVMEAKVAAMPDGGRVMVLEDLTELIEAQQLAAWNEAARRIAHEIKNPLTPIRLSAERLLHRSRQDDDRETLGAAIEEAVPVITREVEAIEGLVDEFARFARMPRPQPREVDLAALLEETVDLYRSLKPGVEVEARVDAGAEHAVLDGGQVKRALINLLDNAVAATEPPGRVRVAAHRHDGHLALEVADTGPGIPAEVRDKLFMPHFSTKRRGTGLGLAIVHRIVTDHRGTIEVHRNRPHGTVFTIELPQG